MSSDTRLAFAHPAERAEATAPDGSALHDRISLRDYVTEAEIGAFQLERGQTQRLRFNLVVEVARDAAPVEDDVDRILSYDRLTEAIAHELAAERLNLLETLAERVAERILAEPRAKRVFVRIEKLDRGPFALGVEIARERGGRDEAPQAHEEAPHPRLVYLSNAAIDSDRLGAWIDAAVAGAAPVIFCVGAPDAPAPRAQAAMPQRRIDLLAIEQNAWVLAGRDRRCLVVGTRTELDWAMKNGVACVWAPCKIVLDAVDGPSADPRDALALVAWFAEQMQAAELLVIGAAPPEAPVPVRAVGLEDDL
ncbi:MAG: dihydroneopterin aldolase FolB [Rhodobacteraceae bacterium HLUCCA08]|nr:MAG: dihydroneopterin aldolase FolB [Rhodobacteraceae bacterium HLUCCA08]